VRVLEGVTEGVGVCEGVFEGVDVCVGVFVGVCVGVTKKPFSFIFFIAKNILLSFLLNPKQGNTEGGIE